MGKKGHNFREFFYLAEPTTKKANKKAAKLCRNHLRKCQNFEAEYSIDKVLEIRAQSVPEDTKKKVAE
ncbi:3116_t:CDS:2, partial [Ambispora gerdemannii]